MAVDPEELQKYADQGVTLAMEYLPKLVLALITLLVGLWVIKRVVRFTHSAMTARGVDPTLVPFVCGSVGWGLRAMLFISVASMIGIQTTSFVAVLGAAGLAIGLALQGSLANFAGGVLLLIFRPFKVGDVIDAQSCIGKVDSISIFTTTLLNAENRKIIIPNGPLSNGVIVNRTTQPTLRIDLVIGVGYGADIDETKRVLMDTLVADARVLKDPAPAVEVLELADSSVNFAVRPHVNTADYWDVYFASLANIKKALDAAGIEIPFPQRDVHLYNHDK